MPAGSCGRREGAGGERADLPAGAAHERQGCDEMFEDGDERHENDKKESGNGQPARCGAQRALWAFQFPTCLASARGDPLLTHCHKDKDKDVSRMQGVGVQGRVVSSFSPL